MERSQKWVMGLLAAGLLVNLFGLFYLWSLTMETSAKSDVILEELDASRKELALVRAKFDELNDRQAAKQASKDQRKGTNAGSVKKAGSVAKAGAASEQQAPMGLSVGLGAGEGIPGKTPFEVKQADKLSKSERYSLRIRTSLEEYAAEHGLDQVVVDEAIVIIEAWADDRRFYKESAQVGDLSADEARLETRAGLTDVQDQLRLLFGEDHYTALDDTISFLGRLQGGQGKE